MADLDSKPGSGVAFAFASASTMLVEKPSSRPRVRIQAPLPIGLESNRGAVESRNGYISTMTNHPISRPTLPSSAPTAEPQLVTPSESQTLEHLGNPNAQQRLGSCFDIPNARLGACRTLLALLFSAEKSVQDLVCIERSGIPTPPGAGLWPLVVTVGLQHLHLYLSSSAAHARP
ncbi:hypothetical protein JHW43_002903 [Diplocarpon mali]|nr:hypothetical protein JHW43_002903 [Diplocarpon mali]